MPKPHTLTPERAKRFLDALRRAGSYQLACAKSHVKRRTLYDWLVRAELDEEPFASFAADIQEVRADLAGDEIDKLKEHGFTSPNASQYLLGVWFPDEFTPKAQTQQSIGEQVMKAFDLVLSDPSFTDAEREKFIRAVARCRDGNGPVVEVEADSGRIVEALTADADTD